MESRLWFHAEIPVPGRCRRALPFLRTDVRLSRCNIIQYSSVPGKLPSGSAAHRVAGRAMSVSCGVTDLVLVAESILRYPDRKGGGLDASTTRLSHCVRCFGRSDRPLELGPR